MRQLFQLLVLEWVICGADVVLDRVTLIFLVLTLLLHLLILLGREVHWFVWIWDKLLLLRRHLLLILRLRHWLHRITRLLTRHLVELVLVVRCINRSLVLRIKVLVHELGLLLISIIWLRRCLLISDTSPRATSCFVSSRRSLLPYSLSPSFLAN